MSSMFATREPSIDALRAAPVYFRWGSNKRRTLVDSFTASAILAVYAVLNYDNKAKFDRMVTTPHGLQKIAALSFQHVK